MFDGMSAWYTHAKHTHTLDVGVLPHSVRDSFIWLIEFVTHSYILLNHWFSDSFIRLSEFVTDLYEAWQVNWRWSSHGRPSTMELCLIQFVIQSLDSFICDKHTRWIGDDDHAVDPSIMKLRLIQFVTQSRDSLSSWLILHSYDSSRGRSLDDGAPPHLVRDSCTCHITHWNVNVTDIKMYR